MNELAPEPEPMVTTDLTPELETEIVTALDEAVAQNAVQGTLDLGEIVVVPAPPKRRRGAAAAATPRKRKVNGLQMYAAEEIPRVGTCTGGIYHWITTPDEAIPLLEHWTAHRALVALDCETSAAWRWVPDPEWTPGEGQTEADRPTIKSYVDTSNPDPKKWDPFGSDPWTSTLFMVQCSVEDGVSIVFDMRSLDPDPQFQETFRRFLKSCRFIGHDLLFDASFLLVKYGVYLNMIFDTAIAQRIAVAGLQQFNDAGAALKDLYRRFLGLQLNKHWQGSFLSIHPESPMPRGAVEYAASDTIQLLAVARRLREELRSKELLHVWEEMERPLMFWVLKARETGMLLDPQPLLELQGVLEEQAGEALQRLNALMPGVNPNAPEQVARWFVGQGATLPQTEKGGFSADEKALNGLMVNAKKAEVREAARALLDYRKVTKQKSTYTGPILYKHLNPVTERLHPYWRQCPTDTGRMSCTSPNFQNIPIRDERAAVIREAFIAPPGFRCITADYSQIELRILAELSGDTRMLGIFQQAYEVNQKLRFYARQHGLVFWQLPGLKETYAKWEELQAEQSPKAERYVAQAEQWAEITRKHPLVPQLLDELALLDLHRKTAAFLFHDGDVAKVTKAERGISKTVNFGIPYGRGPQGIAAGVQVPLERAKEILEQYFRIFPQVKEWLDQTKEQVIADRYTLTPFRRKRFYDLPETRELYDRYVAMMEDPDLQGQWEQFSRKWKTTSPGKIAQKVRASRISAAQREATNAPIQGGNADITKAATLIVAPRLYRLDPQALITMWVHDEIVSIAPTEVAEEAARIQEEGMIEAGQLFLKRCPVEVGLAIDTKWSK